MARGIVAVCIGGLLTVVVEGYAPATEEDSRAVLALGREAVAATQTNFRTGRVEGSFRMWGSDEKLMQSARFTGAFDGSKHYLKLTYTPTGHAAVPIEYDKRILICDGSALFAGRFSEHIHPVGAEADVFESGPVYRHHAAFGFPSIPKKLVSGILSPETLDKYAVEMEQLATGHFRGRYQRKSDYHAVFEIAPEYGYQCILFESFDGTELVNRWTVAWKRVDDLWYVAGCKTERYKDGKHSETNKWQLDKFEANVPVSPDLFTLNALELPDRARIIDRRRPEGPLVTDVGEPIPYEAR